VSKRFDGSLGLGSYQMGAKSGGVADKFVTSPDFPYKAAMNGMQPGSKQFVDKWLQLAKQNPTTFKNAENAFMQRTHYQPMTNRIQKNFGLNMEQQSPALKNAVWSTAMQHGANSNVVDRAFSSMKHQGTFNPRAPAFQENAIKAIYAERGRTDNNGNLLHFVGNSKEMQQFIARRFQQEQKEALNMLSAEAAQQQG